MDYKAIGVFHSFKTSGWKGNITRLLACSPEQSKTYKGWDIGNTFVHPNYHYVAGYEDSATYNKPAALMHFTNEVEIEEEFILYIDADMLLRRVVNPADYDARKGVVVTEYVWYVKEGIENGLAKQFLKDPDAIDRAKGTHGGYYHLFHHADAKKVAPRWLHYTKAMRQHPELYWKDSPGSILEEDIDTAQRGATRGKAPWITEMYGYAFAAAEVGLDHMFTRGGGGVLYGDDFLSLSHPGPIASHYTLSCQIPSKEHYVPEGMITKEQREHAYIFDKHEFRDFNVMDCDDGFLFPNPPRLPLVDEAAALCAEDADRLNYALCDFYRKRCPLNSQAYQNSLETCPFNVNDDYRFHFGNVIPAPCGNQSGDKRCKRRVRNGDCAVDVSGMALYCLKECGFCAEVMTEEDACFDRIASAECKTLADQKECFLNPTFMTFNCRHTCRACPKDLNAMVASNHLQEMENFVEEVAEEVAEEVGNMNRWQILPLAFACAVCIWYFGGFNTKRNRKKAE